jgi:hypothetical protein
MCDIFISYSSEDRGKAKDIAEALKQQGLSVWWDRSILPGETFDTVIEEALDTANCVIVLWSKTSVSSTWVKTEASEGDRRGILIPVLIDDVKIPLAFRRIQAADLKDWGGKLPHPGFDMLSKAIAGILGRPVQSGQKTNEVRDIEPEKLAKQDNSIGMKFTLIHAGEFYMGSEESDDEEPVHKVKIKNPFYLGTYPVTQREWKAVMRRNPSDVNGDDLPVDNVSWDNVQKFIKKLNEKEGTDKYRLPSEAEWEYACRAGTTTRYSLGMMKTQMMICIRSVRRSLIHGVCMTCTAMSANGCRMCGMTAMMAHLLTVARGKVGMAPTGSFAAVAGSTTPGTAGLRFATATTPATATATSAFAF